MKEAWDPYPLLILCSRPSNLPSQKDKQLRSPRRYEYSIPPAGNVNNRYITHLLSPKGMRINTSRGHLPLHHHFWEFGVFEVRNPAMSVIVNAFSTKCSDSRCSHPMPALLGRHRLTWPGVDIYCLNAVMDTSICNRLTLDCGNRV